MSELQVLQNKDARLILDLPVHSSATEALKRLGWKPLVCHRMEYHAVFIYKLLIFYNHFCHTVLILFNGNFQGYYTRSRNNICKSTVNRKWGHWNRLDPTIREAETLTAFKHGLSKAILFIFYSSTFNCCIYIFFNFFYSSF